MKEVSHLVACPMVFNLFCYLSQQVDMLKLMRKAQFKVFLYYWSLFPMFLGRLRGDFP